MKMQPNQLLGHLLPHVQLFGQKKSRHCVKTISTIIVFYNTLSLKYPSKSRKLCPNNFWAISNFWLFGQKVQNFAQKPNCCSQTAQHKLKIDIWLFFA